MLKKIVLGLVLLIVVFVVVVAMQPSDFAVSRSATIAAPPAAVFEQVNDFHNWEAWSPWAKLDPTAKNTFEGPTSGKGAIFRWDGNHEVGSGSMTITESRPSDRILIDLAFLKPFEGTNKTEFTFVPQGDQTKVTWTMSGHNAFVSKAFCLVMNGKKMISDKFDEGLASMKKIVETAPNQSAARGA